MAHLIIGVIDITPKKFGHFFACYNEILGTLLHATMKTWTLCCMLQWKFGQFFSPAKTIFCTLFCMQQRNLWDFYFCNKANFPLAPSLLTLSQGINWKRRRSLRSGEIIWKIAASCSSCSGLRSHWNLDNCPGTFQHLDCLVAWS